MPREFKFNDREKCDNCGTLGAFDFMGDYFCNDCIIACKKCDSIFIKDLEKNKEQKLCGDCKNEKL